MTPECGKTTSPFLATLSSETNYSQMLLAAYDEYCHLAESGDAPSVAIFCEKYPHFRHSLGQLIQVRNWCEVKATQDAIPWPQVGRRLAGFELVEVIGQGNFARVYLAQQLDLASRQVAIKLTRTDCSEARLLARLDHKNIIPIYSIGKVEKTNWSLLCMPFWGRTTIAQLLDILKANQPPFDVELILKAIGGRDANHVGEELAMEFRQRDYVTSICKLGMGIAAGLAHVHAAGITHGDLKPSNVLLGFDGRPLLLDFNLAYDRQNPVGRSGGTIPYMATEVLTALAAKDELTFTAVHPPGDVFALGVILYELLTGKYPFGQIPSELDRNAVCERLIARHHFGADDLSKTNPQVCEKLANIIFRCLAHNPKARPLAGELCDLLSQSDENKRSTLFNTPNVDLQSKDDVAKLRTPPLTKRSFRAAIIAAGIMLAFGVIWIYIISPGSITPHGQAAGHMAIQTANIPADLIEEGWGHLENQKWERAQECFRLANPTFTISEDLPAYAYAALKLSNYQLAMTILAKLDEAGKLDGINANNYGVALVGYSRWSEANSILDRAVVMDPKNPVIRFNRLYVNLLRLRVNDTNRVAKAQEDVQILKSVSALPGFVYLIVAEVMDIVAKHYTFSPSDIRSVLKAAVENGLTLENIAGHPDLKKYITPDLKNVFDPKTEMVSFESWRLLIPLKR